MRIWIGLVAFGLVLCGQIREERKVLVNGVMETWQLRWKSPPKPVCESNEEAAACPCMGFAFGESGELDLVRRRNNVEIDRLELTPFFGEVPSDEEHKAVVSRWDLEPESSASGASLGRRKAKRLMQFEDYDHDGAKSEFFLQTSTLPCGKSYGVVVGISKIRPKLHAFRSRNAVIVVQKQTWLALKNSRQPVRVVEWPCDDHAAEEETEVEIGWSKTGIDGMVRQYSCGRKPRIALSEQPL